LSLRRGRRTQPLSTERGSAGTFSILTVCTGKRLQVAGGGAITDQKLGPTAPVSSAGVHALVGHPVSEPMAKLLRSNGAEDVVFAARPLTEKLVKEADLVLALTRAQRSFVVELSRAQSATRSPYVSSRRCSDRSMPMSLLPVCCLPPTVMKRGLRRTRPMTTMSLIPLALAMRYTPPRSRNLRSS
jgi:protein-tyrosine-phosphatase